MEKTDRNNTKYSRSNLTLNINLLAKAIAHAKAIPFPNGQFGSKIENAKNMPKLILQEY